MNERGESDYYVLPKGALIEFNGPFLVRNKENGFKNPLEFDINNFLDDNDRFKNPMASDLGVFGFGKRNCPGMALARKENLFAIAFLVYNYKFCGPEGAGDVDFEVPRFSTKPSFPLHVTKRR